MDMSTLKASLNMLHGAMSMTLLDKAMNRGADTMETMLADMQAANPAPAVLAPKAGAMDIKV